MRRSPRCVATALCRRRLSTTSTDNAGSAAQLPEVEFDGVLTKRKRHVNFCLRCGTRVEGAFCANCGASTSLDQYVAPEGELDPEVPSPEADVLAQPVAVPSVAPDSIPANSVTDVSLPVNEAGRIVGGLPLGRARRSLVLETRWVMVAFLLPVVMSAVLVFAEHVSGVGDISRFPSIVHGHPVTNMILGTFAYLPVAATVPLALFLLARTGQVREVLGLGVPRFKRDVVPGWGLAAAAFGCEIALLIPFAQFMVKG